MMSAYIVGKRVIRRGSAPSSSPVQVLERSRKLIRDEVVLKLGDGKAVAAEAVGIVHLVVSDQVRIELKDCYYWTPPGTPQLNDVSERRNQTLLDTVQSMMNFIELPLSFWGYALETTAKFVGYPKETAGYYFYDPSEQKVFVSQNAVFLEKDFPADTRREELLLEESSEATPQTDTVTSSAPIVPTNDIPILRRSTKVSQQPERYGFLGLTGQLDNDPKTCGEAMSDIDSKKWIEAMKSEMDSMSSNKMDVKTAFLNGFVEEEIYMDQPKGFTSVGEEQKVCHLQRFIYGLKQASRSWNIRFDEVIRGYDFIKKDFDPCVYKKVSGSSVVFLVLYVDDILLIGNYVKMLGDTKAWLSTQFSMKDLGEAFYILGIKVIRDRSKRMLGMTQTSYVEKVLKRFKMENSKRGFLPMRHRIKLSKKQSPKADEELRKIFDIPYASAVGSIQYAVQCTRPDVAFALSVTSRY
ncbi:UNVERIFIED_CONTAM: Retrovirus-related Pol polyprotein from transposon TNT 1-94 [Sesamum radiatum]|uniref:Retrovirus-related Pol polyprotein from transposon TNT 1-94 n=2 Tax=Sesamum radiatum TaxID=300843 RepID=A0AAW2PK73_SESRA